MITMEQWHSLKIKVPLEEETHKDEVLPYCEIV